MSKWSAWKFTDAGKAIQLKAEAGKTLEFTKLVLGDGFANSIEDYKTLNDLLSPQITCDIANITVQDNKFAKVTAAFNNSKLTADTYLREMGLFAKEPDTGTETLFAVAIDEAADTVPAKGTAAVVTKTFNVYIMVGDAEKVTATIDPTGLVTQDKLTQASKDIEANVTKSATTLIGTYTDSIFRQPSTAYSVGDVAYVKGAGAKYRLACVTAGTTGTDELATSLTAGLYITDGTVTWIIEDTTQADAVGDITLHPTLLSGHILANGATVKASEYPRLLAWVQDNAMTGDDDAHYAYDADADTLKLPNAIGRVLQGAASVATKAAGLPNITGQFGWPQIDKNDEANGCPNGAFKRDYISPYGGSYGVEENSDKFSLIGFYASRSNAIYGASDTVQPPAITLLAQIKY